MRRSILVGALLASATLAGAGRAASTQFAGTLDLRAGYGSNPYLSATGSPGSVLLGGTLSAGLTSLTARSSTLLSGSVDIEQNLKHYGRNENYTAALTRSQQLTQRLTINGSLGYANTINPGTSYQNSLNSGALFQNNVVTTPVDPAAGNVATVPAAPVSTALATFNPANLDLFTLGQRSQRYSAGGGLTWTPTARDQFSLSGNASRTKYNRIIGNYDQFAASASLLHAISDKTRVGLSGSYSLVDSVDYPTAESYGLNLLLVQQLSARWSLNAAVGGLLPRGGVGQSSQLTLGFNVSLCGDYGRSRVCFTGSRQSAPTGIGGLRTDLQGGFTLSYELTEHDHLNAGATFDHSGAGSGSASVLAKQDYYQASGGFSHDVSNRIAVGGSGRYQKRTGGGFFGSASGYAVTVDVITRFGHVAR